VTSSTSFETLPQPFAWLTIPAGKVKIISIISKEGRGDDNYIPKGTSQIFDVPAFEIAKYPITNAQYGKFIEANGYRQRQWWTDAGWHENEQLHWTEPLFWQDAKWNQAEHPVVGVSWYEAIAFCSWLSAMTDEKVVLPSEQEWQRAALGDTEQLTWADECHYWTDCCNWDSEGTTPVTQYQGKSDSPFGVVDMIGNAWEWCLTKVETGSNELNGIGLRIARGGSWVLFYSHEINISPLDRKFTASSARLNYVGFRIVRH
jgi:formylglycine-generating enzyme required for sulfatase activity